MVGRGGMRILFLVLVLVVRCACAEFYQPWLMDSHWQLQTGKLACRMSQEIPHLGQVLLLQEAGEPLRFVLRLNQRKMVADASLRIEPAPWQHRALSGLSYPVVLTTDDESHQQLEVRGDTAERMLAALYAGHFPSYTLQRPWRNGFHEVRVDVSSVRFWEKHDEFQNCRIQLPAFGLRDFRDLNFYFRQQQLQLPQETSSILAKLAHYLKLSGKGQVMIRNATAGVAGTAGQRWFQKRYAVIKKRLRQLGLRTAQISIRKSSDKPRIEMTVFGPEGLLLYHYGRHQENLSALQKRRLALLARYLRDYFPGKLWIHGHSDGARWRSEKANRALARRWAEKVRDYLITEGVEASRLEIRVWGSKRRVASNLSRDGQARNRRIVIDLEDEPTLTAGLDQSG